MSIWRYADRFAPQIGPAHRVTLGEGGTPLLRSRRIGSSAGIENLLFKVETSNPTGSYKDRFAAAAVADMLAHGKRRCVATSSGNTGAALAAYCAAAGITCQITIVETAPREKLAQMLAYGARLSVIRGFGVDPQITARTFAAVEHHAQSPDAALQISAYCKSPAGMVGVQTIGYELREQLEAELACGQQVHVLVPAGGGGLTLAVARGLAGTPVRVHCVQPAGNATIAAPLREGLDSARSVACATTISGLQVPTVLDGNEVIAACRASGGSGHLVEDTDTYAMQQRLAREEGVFCEPAGAIAVAAAVEAAKLGELQVKANVVCIVSGIAFKDQQSLARMAAASECNHVEIEAFEQPMNDR